MKVTYLKFVGGQSPWYWKLYLLIVSAVVYQMVMEYLCLCQSPWPRKTGSFAEIFLL